jgi:hypothetical protein
MGTVLAPRAAALAAAAALSVIVAATLFAGIFEAFIGTSPSASCASGAASGSSGIVLGPPGSGQIVGASEYGGPGDPSSGTVGSSGVSLDSKPDSYAELGGTTFAGATAMGGLPYETPLRITWAGHSAIAYKRDIGLGGGPIDGRPRVIDLWWRLAEGLGIPYEDGEWSGPVKVERPPATGAASLLSQSPPISSALTAADCTPDSGVGVALAPGDRATLLAGGQAAAPATAPGVVAAMIAAGNQLVAKPYVYGGGHGLPLSEIAPVYDCSSSVDHMLYGAGLVPATFDGTSTDLESFGRPGPGRWVTIYASADHVFMYVAGLRWDTHNAAGPQDGSTGIGWHPLVRNAGGFVARHPVGL